jgi:hypothetical protein
VLVFHRTYPSLSPKSDLFFFSVFFKVEIEVDEAEADLLYKILKALYHDALDLPVSLGDAVRGTQLARKVRQKTNKKQKRTYSLTIL